MPEQYKSLQGFRDVLPDEQPYWRYFEKIAAQVAELYGYRRIETPTLEETAVFHKTSGEGTDIVEHEMYTFDDRADKEGRRLNIAIRPEGTAGVVRAYLEHGMFKMPQPVKLYYMSLPIFRREKPQAGRYREHHQFGCEALGESDPALDAEIIGLLYQIYTSLGLRDITISINSIGDQNCRPQYIELLKDYYQPLLEDCCEDCKVRFVKNPLRLLDCKKPQDQPKIAAAPRITDHLCEPCEMHFTAVKRYLEAYQVPYQVDKLIVRGLDYYTRTVFEALDRNGLALNGGGRYDGLAEILGGAPTAGIGFGLGVERAVLEIKRQGIVLPEEAQTQAFVVYFGKTPEFKDAAVEICASLRLAGIKTEMSYHDRSGKAQMKQANNAGARFAIILGDEELANNLVSVKNLQVQDGDGVKQVQIKREHLITYLKQE